MAWATKRLKSFVGTRQVVHPLFPWFWLLQPVEALIRRQPSRPPLLSTDEIKSRWPFYESFPRDNFGNCNPQHICLIATFFSNTMQKCILEKMGRNCVNIALMHIMRLYVFGLFQIISYTFFPVEMNELKEKIILFSRILQFIFGQIWIKFE